MHFIVPQLSHASVKQCSGVSLRHTCVNLSDRHVKTHMDVEHVLTFPLAPVGSRWDHGHKRYNSGFSRLTFVVIGSQHKVKSWPVITISSKWEFSM